MKRLFQWLLAAILICSTNVITACSKDDEKKSEDVTPAKLAGFWMTDNAESGTDGEASWTRVVEDYLFYADGKLTAQGKTWQKATLEQQALVNQLYGDWQAANSASEDTDDSKFENVDGNVDVNNGGGGVNVVR